MLTADKLKLRDLPARVYWIYGLVDPRNGEIRYIGQSLEVNLSGIERKGDEMRLDQQSRQAKQRAVKIRREVESYVVSEPLNTERRDSYYHDAEDCGHLAHVRQIINDRCPRCVGLTMRDGNGNLVA